MTREEVIQLAREVGINIEKSNVGDALMIGWPIKAGAFEHFANLVRQQALEDAAKECEVISKSFEELALEHPEESESRSRCFARSRASTVCASAIRTLEFE